MDGQSTRYSWPLRAGVIAGCVLLVLVGHLSHFYLLLFNPAGIAGVDRVWAGSSILLLAAAWLVVLRLADGRVSRLAGGLLASSCLFFFVTVITSGVGCQVSGSVGQVGPLPVVDFSTRPLLGLELPTIRFTTPNGRCGTYSHLVLWLFAYGSLVAGLWFDRGVDASIRRVTGLLQPAEGLR